MVTRRERTRRLIELGGLVAKSELVAAADDDRAAIFGALLDATRGFVRSMAISYCCCGDGAVRESLQIPIPLATDRAI